MSILTGSADERQPLDWAMIALAGLVVSAAVVLGIFALGAGFVTTLAYEHDWQWVSFVCGIIGAGCVAYLLLEFSGPKTERAVLFAVAAGGIFGYLAVSNGIPAAMTAAYGQPGTEIFTVVDAHSGGKHCDTRLVLRHPHYSDARICRDGIPGPRPGVGSRIEYRGLISDWGMTRDGVRAL